MIGPDVRVVPAALAAAFADTLHRAGVPATPERASRFARALQLVPPTDLGRLYRTARATLVSDRSQLATFDRVFAAVFDGAVDLADSRGAAAAPPVRTPARRSPTVPTTEDDAGGLAAPAGAFGRPGSAEDDGEAVREARIAAASPAERLGTTAFPGLSGSDLADVRRLVRDMAVATPIRTTRRTRRSGAAGDRLDLRRTVRHAHRTAGDPAVLVRRRRRTRPRRLVFLCDVSASMEPYTLVYLTLLHRAVMDTRAEAFVFATRLTRLTRPLRRGSPDAALRRAGAAAPDWAGGTRLGESLRRFVTDHGRHGLARGAVVVILSDGWAGDDPELVAEQMARLRRLAYRIVWVNPRKAAPGYEPLVGGMAAALPYCDAFASGHSLAALTEVAEAIREGRNGT